MPALPFGKLRLTAKKPLNSSYPEALHTLGDHLRKRRLDLGLTQSSLTIRLRVDKSSLLNWELNRTSPAIRYIPRIYDFLGYCPLPEGGMRTLSQIIRAWREGLGMSQEELAKAAGVDETSIAKWEAGKAKPMKKSLTKITIFFRGRF